MSESLSREDILLLKVAELTLHRDFVASEVRGLLSTARKAGNGAQTIVLTHRLDELERRVKDAEAVKWPSLEEKGTT